MNGRRGWITKHPAAAARVVTVGLAVSGFFAMVAAFARSSPSDAPDDSSPRRIEVRVGDDVDTAELRTALETWLAGDPDVDRDGGLRVVEAPPDTATTPS